MKDLQLVDLGLQLEPGVQLETSAIMAACLCRLDRSCTSAISSFDQFNGLLLRVYSIPTKVKLGISDHLFRWMQNFVRAAIFQIKFLSLLF